MNLSLAVVAATVLLAADSTPTEEQLRATVERSLPFIQSEGQRWIDEKKCVTCHQVPFMVWALNSAADRGLTIDRQKLQSWNAWATDWKHMASKQQLEEGERPTLSAQHDSVAQLLLGRSAADREPGAVAWPAQFAEYLSAGQLADGSWKSGGQLPSQRRPERETNEVTTMWALVALQSYAASEESLQTKLTKARSWLGSQAVGQSTEWWAARLLADRSGGDAAAAHRVRESLLSRQQADGGWGWLSSDDSDAFATGVALYALTRDGLSSDHSAIAQGRLFLTQSQRPNGSWSVKGTKKDKGTQEQPTATYWGTCWAVIGLLETLPRTSP